MRRDVAQRSKSGAARARSAPLSSSQQRREVSLVSTVAAPASMRLAMPSGAPAVLPGRPVAGQGCAARRADATALVARSARGVWRACARRAAPDALVAPRRVMCRGRGRRCVASCARSACSCSMKVCDGVRYVNAVRTVASAQRLGDYAARSATTQGALSACLGLRAFWRSSTAATRRGRPWRDAGALRRARWNAAARARSLDPC